MTDEARELASLLLKPPSREATTMLQGVVSALDTPSQISVYLSGATFAISGIHFLDSYAPRVNDVVWIAKTGPDLLVVGRLQDDPYDATLPWNIAWGDLATVLDTSSPSFAALTPDLIVGSNIPMKAGRKIKLIYCAPHRSNAASTVADFSMQWRPSGGGWTVIRALRSTPNGTGTSSTDTITGVSNFNVPSDGNYDVKVVGSRIAGTGTVTMGTAQTIEVMDAGPVTPI